MGERKEFLFIIYPRDEVHHTMCLYCCIIMYIIYVCIRNYAFDGARYLYSAYEVVSLRNLSYIAKYHTLYIIYKLVFLYHIIS